MPRIDLASITPRAGSNYPSSFAALPAGRIKKSMGEAAGLTDFGVNLTRLPPGSWSSQRHWHTHEDEFVHVLSGALHLVTDAGEVLLQAGDSAAFPKAVADGHHLINRGDTEAVYLEIGSRSAKDTCHYPDIDLYADAHGYSHKDGSPYDEPS